MSIKLTCTFLGCERKPESLQKPHADVGRICKLHNRQWPCQESIFPPHQRYNEMLLFKDLLYVLKINFTCFFLVLMWLLGYLKLYMWLTLSIGQHCTSMSYCAFWRQRKPGQCRKCQEPNLTQRLWRHARNLWINTLVTEWDSVHTDFTILVLGIWVQVTLLVLWRLQHCVLGR